MSELASEPSAPSELASEPSAQSELASELVRAAGGAVWRRGPTGIEVLLVHRPRYDDWSLPKGKVDPGETDEEAAAREVTEEACVVGRLGAELAATSYLDRSGKQKKVRYWAMTVAAAEAAPAHEVDQVAWLSLGDARARLSYPRDAGVLDSLAGAVAPVAAMKVAGLDHVVLVVADVERSLGFYAGLLGLAPVRVEEWRRREAPFPSVRVDAGTIIDLLPGAARGGPANVDHVCLVVRPTDLHAVARSGAFEVVDGPARRFGARGEGLSLYVRDPDGNTVELRHYG